jgi:hypothetical protein
LYIPEGHGKVWKKWSPHSPKVATLFMPCKACKQKHYWNQACARLSHLTQPYFDNALSLGFYKYSYTWEGSILRPIWALEVPIARAGTY